MFAGLLAWLLGAAGRVSWAVAKHVTNTPSARHRAEHRLSFGIPTVGSASSGFSCLNELVTAAGRRSRRSPGRARCHVRGCCQRLLPARLHQGTPPPHHFLNGVWASILARGILWGTMYIPYRKGLPHGIRNPLSFVTFFSVGANWAIDVLRQAPSVSPRSGPELSVHADVISG